VLDGKENEGEVKETDQEEFDGYLTRRSTQGMKNACHTVEPAARGGWGTTPYECASTLRAIP